MKKIDKKNKYKGNPRKISDKQKRLLKEHIEELGDLSGVVYCRNNKAYVGGNQRADIFDGCEIEVVKEYERPTATKTVLLGYINKDGEKHTYREVEFSEEEFKKACVVANNDGGEFDWTVLSDWESDKLEEWGLELPVQKATEILSTLEYQSVYYEPVKKPNIKLRDCLNLDKYEAKLKMLDEYDLTDEQKEVLKFFAYRFIKIDYENVANYYFFNASEEEKKAIERLRLVLCDSGLQGFVEDDMLKILKKIEEWENL